MQLQVSARYSNAADIFTFLNIVLVVSFPFWPLLNSIAVVLLAACWLFLMPKSREAFHDNKLLIILFALPWFMLVAGSFYSANLPEAFKMIRVAVPMLAFPVILGTISIDLAQLSKRVLIAFARAIGAAVLYCFVRGFYHLFADGTTEYMSGYNMISLKQTYPYILGLCCVTTVWIEYLYNFKLSGERTGLTDAQKLSLTNIILMSIFILLLGNRVVLMLWLFSILIVIFQLVRTVRMRLLISLVLVIALVAAFFAVPKLRYQVNDFADFSGNNRIQLDVDSSQGRSWGGKAIRVAIWTCAMDVVKSHPVPGVGTGDAQDSLQQAYENRKFYFASFYNRYNAHNQYLQATITGGVISLFILLSAFAFPFIRFAGKKGSVVYLIFLLSIMIIFFTESMLETNKGI
ncbi:MAG: O-antigen ligase family protein, partial [Chitinophagaceae bacterium]